MSAFSPLYFNSRPSARGDGNPHAPLIGEKYFNSRPSARGDFHPVLADEFPDKFQFTPLREGRRCFDCGYIGELGKFQFTPLREGRPRSPRSRTAPNKFQFTPLREGRPSPPTSTPITTAYFNSRPSARGDCAAKESRLLCFISIHAPPRGATQQIFEAVHVVFHFNSRPSARGDGKRYAISANLLFNPYKSAWLNNSATQFVEIILVIFHRIIA